ncbi:hypothetical protein BDZ91DRAFT_418854 [Kalaharituber pfeilii]|nr:hypothetical protein BDZ91DRAFT_418854 [Kalaharituber pfeilii]
MQHPESEQTSLKFSRTELDTLLGVDNPEKFGAGTAHGELKVREPGSLRVRRMITGDSQNNHSGGHQTRHVPLKEAPRPEIGIKTDGVRHKLAIVGSDPKFSARPISKKNTPTAKLMAKSKPVPTFISRILSSPNMKSWYKSKSGFWVDVVKRWYVPDHIQNRLILDTKTAMLNNKPKESLTRNIFNHDHPMPLRPYHFHKLGALPIEVIQLFEETAKHDIDLLFELARRGEYSAARWIVRRILHPQIPDIHELEEGGAGDVLGTFNWAVHDKLKKLNGHDAENLSAARAGDFGLGHLLSDPSSSNILNTQLWHVKLARQGLGFVLRSIGKMLVAADPSALLTSSPKTFFSYSSTIPSPARKSGYSVLGNKQDKVNEYRRLLAFSKELLAYLHNSSIIPKNLYSSDINPRLSILKTRILTGLADAVWRHQELSQLELKEEEAQNQAYTVPDYGCRLHGYWRGGFETLTGDSPQWSKLWKGDSAQTASLSPGAKRQEAVQLAEMGNRGEREVLIELTLRICALAGFGCAGSRILKDIITQGGWSWIDYKAMWPEEYRPEDLALREELESTDGLPGQWGVRGYAVLPPPIRTVPLKLPVDIISQISSALIDSVAEGKGIKEVIKGLEQLGEMFGREIFGQDGSQIASRSNNTISRLVGLWEDECEIGNGDPHSGEMILMLIQKWSDLESKVPGEISPGEASTEIRVWYRVLQNYINVENPDGAIRIWNAMQNRISILLPGNDAPIAVPKDNRDYQNEYRKREETHYYHPPWVSGPFLAMLNQYKMTSFGDSLLHPHEQSPFPIIPRHYYHLPQITPPLLALASLKKDLDLLNKILASLPLHIAGAVTHSTITSILNTYLQFDDFSSAKEVLNYLTAQGTQIDGIDIAVLVENILRHSKNDGYNFVEQVMKSEDTANPLSEFSPNLRVGSQWGNWKLPLRATAVKRDQQYTVFEGQLIARTPSSDPAPPPKPKMSPSGWISVLNHAIETSDRQRVEWALKGLGIDLRKRGSMSTKIFNILLKGVIIRNGPIAGWNMITEHCVDNPESGVGGTHDGYWVRKVGKGAEWHWVHGGKTRDGVVPDLVTFRTVLDGAVKQHKDIEKEISMEWKRVRKHDWWAEQEDFAVESGDVPRLQKGLDTGVKQTRNRELEEWKANISKLEKKRKELEELVRLCRKKMKMMGGL